MSEANLYTQLAKAQAEFTSPKRTKEVKGSYSFAYAPLDEVLAAVRPALAKHGLFLTQGLVSIGEAEHIQTRVYYGAEYIENHWPLINTQPGAQKHGGAGTFARRYGVSALLGLAPEDDDDANASEGNPVTIHDRRPPPSNGNRPSPKPQVKPLPAPAKTFSQVYDPETGEIEGVKPHAIERDGNWVNWGTRFVAEITGTKSRRTAEAWVAANEEAIEACEVEHPAVFKRLAANIKAMREKLEDEIPADFMTAQ